MAYCKSCGGEVNSTQDFCPNCGASIKAQNSNQQQPQQYQQSNVEDTGGFGWGFLGFCIPLVGLILYLVWRQEKPLTAKAALTGAIIGFVLNVISGIIYAIAMAPYLAGY